MTLTPSHIIEYLYCPRFTYFEYVLCIPQNEDKYYKAMKGREVHTEKSKRNKDYLREKIGVEVKYTNKYLTNDYLRGEVDEVLILKDGTMAPLDYKFAEYKEIVYETYKTQLVCYSILIEDNFNKSVERGYLVYTRSKNKLVEVPINDNDKNDLKDTVNKIFLIIENNFFPKSTKYKTRCIDCTYRNICIK